jgi:hypothetical protein
VLDAADESQAKSVENAHDEQGDAAGVPERHLDQVK